MFDNSEFTAIIEKLEQFTDEQLATELLQQFTAAHSKASKLILNRDENLSHQKWKDACDQANRELEEVVARIDRLYSQQRRSS